MADLTRRPEPLPPNVTVLNDWIAERTRRQFGKPRRPEPRDDSQVKDDDGGDVA